jgi:hypothetical protein
MYEYSQVWTLVGPDGTTVIFNDGSSGLWLEDVTGWDSPTIRTNVEDLPESDGAVASDAWLGQRPWTMKGKVAASSAAGRNAAVVSMQQALRALRGDLVAKSQPCGLPAMQASARIADFKLSGGYVKDFIISLISPDPRAYSQALNTQQATGIASIPGAAFNWAFDVNFGGGSGATVNINASNAGNIEAPAVFRVWGPITGIQVKNGTSGDSIYVDNVTLIAGEYIDIDTGARTVTKNDGTNLYNRVRFPGSVWWRMKPGSNSIQLWATSGTTSQTELDAIWRDAWA